MGELQTGPLRSEASRRSPQPARESRRPHGYRRENRCGGARSGDVRVQARDIPRNPGPGAEVCGPVESAELHEFADVGSELGQEGELEAFFELEAGFSL